jgi:hypothetical protein
MICWALHFSTKEFLPSSGCDFIYKYGSIVKNDLSKRTVILGELSKIEPQCDMIIYAHLNQDVGVFFNRKGEKEKLAGPREHYPGNLW